MTFRKKIKNTFTKRRTAIFVILAFALVLLLNVAYSRSDRSRDFETAKVSEIISEYDDGGIFYQVLNIDGQEVKVELDNSEVFRYEESDNLYVSKTGKSEIRVLGLDRGIYIMVTVLLLFALLILTIGLDDIKELIPILFVIPFLVSGLLYTILNNIDYVIFLGLLSFCLTWIVMYVSTKDWKLSILFAVANVCVILMVFLLAYLLREFLRLNQIYQYDYVYKDAFDFNEYKNWKHLSMGFVTVGLTLGATISVAENYSLRSIQKADSLGIAIKKLLVKSQSHIARKINVLFFIFLGLSILPFMMVSERGNMHPLNSILVLENIVYFIIAGFSVILSVLLATLVAILHLRKKRHGKI